MRVSIEPSMMSVVARWRRPNVQFRARADFLATRIISCGSDPAARPRRLRSAFGGSSAAGSGQPAAPGAGGTAGRLAEAGVSAAVSAGSNCRPNCTDGSKKLLMELNGTTRRSGMPPNDRPTSKRSSVTTRSQNWCWRMTVISSGYCASSRGDSFTPSAVRQKGDEEMMLAGQAVLGGVGQHPAQHPAQRVARQHVVSDMIGRHYRSCRVQMLPAARRRCRCANSPVSRMLPRRRAEVSRRCRRWRKFQQKAPVVKR